MMAMMLFVMLLLFVFFVVARLFFIVNVVYMDGSAHDHIMMFVIFHIVHPFPYHDMAFMGLAMAGTDVWLSSKVGVNIEARYTHGAASLNQDFSSYNTLDLSGFQAGLGLTIRW